MPQTCRPLRSGWKGGRTVPLTTARAHIYWDVLDVGTWLLRYKTGCFNNSFPFFYNTTIIQYYYDISLLDKGESVLTESYENRFYFINILEVALVVYVVPIHIHILLHFRLIGVQHRVQLKIENWKSKTLNWKKYFNPPCCSNWIFYQWLSVFNWQVLLNPSILEHTKILPCRKGTLLTSNEFQAWQKYSNDKQPAFPRKQSYKKWVTNSLILNYISLVDNNVVDCSNVLLRNQWIIKPFWD